MQVAQMALDDAQVFIAKLPGKHAEERRETIGAEISAPCSSAMHLSRLSTPTKNMQYLGRTDTEPRGISGGNPTTPKTDSLLRFNGLVDNIVHLPDDGRVLQAIGKDVLAIEDRLWFIEARQDRPFAPLRTRTCRRRTSRRTAYFSSRSCVNAAASGGRLPFQIKISISVHQVGFHDGMRSFTPS